MHKNLILLTGLDELIYVVKNNVKVKHGWDHIESLRKVSGVVVHARLPIGDVANPHEYGTRVHNAPSITPVGRRGIGLLQPYPIWLHQPTELTTTFQLFLKIARTLLSSSLTAQTLNQRTVFWLMKMFCLCIITERETIIIIGILQIS
ncbi:hypothetical protein YC2023_024671 [Brassica napus]